MANKELDACNADVGDFLERVHSSPDESFIKMGNRYPIVKKEEFHSVSFGASTAYIILSEDGREFRISPRVFYRWRIFIPNDNKDALSLLKEKL